MIDGPPSQRPPTATGRGNNATPASTYSIWSMYKQMFLKVRTQWKLMAIALVSMLAISGLEFIIPQLTRYTIDTVIPGKLPNALPWIVVAVLATAVVLGICSFFSSYLLANIGQRAINSLRNDLYRHIQALDMQFFDRNRTGDLMSRVTSDINQLQQVVSGGMLQIITDLFTFIAIAIYMFYTDWLLTSVMMATFPLLFVTTRFFRGRMRASFRRVQQSAAEVSNHLQDTLSAMRLIKSYNTEGHEAERFTGYTQANMQANIHAVKLRAVYEPIIDLLTHLGAVVVLAFGAWQAIQGKLTVGEIVAFLAYLRLLQNPIRHFSRLITTIQQAGAAYDRVMEILGTKPTIVDRPDARPLPPIQGKVEFDQVDFAYQPGKPVLQQLSLVLEAGRTTALVGPSGSGKSTITHLLGRFYEPQAGEIRIDGHAIADVTLASLRGQMGVVSQDILLLNGSIRDNIAYGRPDATDEQIIAAATAANAHSFIESIPGGYDAQVGERGVKLSGGQKQRLSIARALLVDPLLAILDEATASLDTESEHLIQQGLAALLRNRTCLVIAHRLSTIQQADHIYVLDQGRIIESGTHESLLRLNGKYRQLYELQFPQDDTAGP